MYHIYYAKYRRLNANRIFAESTKFGNLQARSIDTVDDSGAVKLELTA